MTPSDQPSAPRGRPERRDDIVRAALRCFTRKGYNNTTMDDIVAESELSKGTLYWYFDSKEDLFQAALLSVFEGFGGDPLPALAQCDTGTERLRCLGHSTAAFSDSVAGYFGLFLEFWISRPHREEANRVWYNLLEQYKRILSAIIEDGIDAGEFRPVDAEALVWALMATYDGLAAYASFVEGLDLDHISRTFTEVMLEGLVSQGDTRAGDGREPAEV